MNSEQTPGELRPRFFRGPLIAPPNAAGSAPIRIPAGKAGGRISSMDKTILLTAVAAGIICCWIGCCLDLWLERHRPQPAGPVPGRGIHPRWLGKPVRYFAFPIWLFVVAMVCVLALPVVVVRWASYRPPRSSKLRPR